MPWLTPAKSAVVPRGESAAMRYRPRRHERGDTARIDDDGEDIARTQAAQRLDRALHRAFQLFAGHGTGFVQHHGHVDGGPGRDQTGFSGIEGHLQYGSLRAARRQYAALQFQSTVDTAARARLERPTGKPIARQNHQGQNSHFFSLLPVSYYRRFRQPVPRIYEPPPARLSLVCHPLVKRMSSRRSRIYA